MGIGKYYNYMVNINLYSYLFHVNKIYMNRFELLPDIVYVNMISNLTDKSYDTLKLISTSISVIISSIESKNYFWLGRIKRMANDVDPYGDISGIDLKHVYKSLKVNNTLLYNVILGNLDVVKVTIAFGADIRIYNDLPTIEAASNGHIAIVDLLRIHGADLGADNNRSLINASSNGHYDIVKLLLSYGIVDYTYKGKNAFTEAAENGHVEVLKLLLNYNNQTYPIDAELIKASKKGRLDVVRVLLDYGDVNKNYPRAADYARRAGHQDVANALWDYWCRYQSHDHITN